MTNECDPEGSGIDVSLLECERVSPIEWDSNVFYGLYILNPKFVRHSARLSWRAFLHQFWRYL